MLTLELTTEDSDLYLQIDLEFYYWFLFLARPGDIVMHAKIKQIAENLNARGSLFAWTKSMSNKHVLFF